MLDKKIIKKRFKNSLNTYNQEASTQDNMAIKLINTLIQFKGKTYENILEIGCGTGRLTELIVNNLNFHKLYVNDIVEETQEQITNLSSSISFIAGDAESIDFPNNLDLIVSNATIQWFNDFPGFLYKAYNSLNPNGILAFTSFGSLNLIEISKLTKKSLPYKSIDEIREISKEYFELPYTNEEISKLYFDSPIRVLKHLKYTGVNAFNTKIWTRQALNEFKHNYTELFSENNQVRLTYNPIYLILEKQS